MSRYTFLLPELKPPLQKLINGIVNGFQQYQDLYKIETFDDIALDIVPCDTINIIVMNLTYYYLYLSYLKHVVTDVDMNNIEICDSTGESQTLNVTDAQYLEICDSCKILNENLDPQILCNISFKLLYRKYEDVEKTSKAFKIIQDIATVTMKKNHIDLPLIKVRKESIL